MNRPRAFGKSLLTGLKVFAAARLFRHWICPSEDRLSFRHALAADSSRQIKDQLMMTERCYFQSLHPMFSIPQLQANAAGYSAVGIRHRANEDRFLVESQRGLFLVADGMGGMRAGERAAQMAVDLLAQHPALYGCDGLDDEQVRRQLQQAFLDVNADIVAEAERDPHLYGMGTTAVLGLLRNDRLHLASLGDSRAYLLRDGDLHQYTVDHNLAQTLVTMGAITA